MVKIPVGPTSTTVDDADADLASRKWRLSMGRYAARSIWKNNNGNEWMHRVILERSLGRPILPQHFVDHIDGNGLNNTRANLREVNKSGNMQNRRGPDSKNRTGFRNVRFDKRCGLYRAVVFANGKYHQRGSYRTAAEAAWVAQQMRHDLGLLDGATPRVRRPKTTTPRQDGRIIYRNNKSGFRGVRQTDSGRWVAYAYYGGEKGRKRVHAGTYDTAEQANEAATALRARLVADGLTKAPPLH